MGVVGYGQQKRVNVTGAVGTISGKDLNNRPVTNTAAALQGADPSLLLTLGSGSIEGKNYDVKIRGAVSLNSGSPLVLVDGIEALRPARSTAPRLRPAWCSSPPRAVRPAR